MIVVQGKRLARAQATFSAVTRKTSPGVRGHVRALVPIAITLANCAATDLPSGVSVNTPDIESAMEQFSEIQSDLKESIL